MATPIPRNRASFMLSELASLGRLVGADIRITGVTTDSRAVGRGELFVALRGESFDGHGFVAGALGLGAGAALVSDASVIPDGASALVVDDTLVALGEVARLHRRRWGRTVVGITGSAGKTTTKELVRTALEATGLRVHATHGNLNNRIGVPMTLLEIDESVDVAVVEMGTSVAGEIATLAAIAEPELAVITSIGLSHAAGIGSVDDVAREKGALFEAPSVGICIVNLDDDRVGSLPRRGRVVTYGTAADADVRVEDPRIDDRGASCVLAIRGRSLPLSLSIPSRVALVNAAAAVAVATSIGRDEAEATRGLSSTASIEGRMKPIRLASGTLVVDDTYNANPKSMLAALESCSELARARGGRVVVVLGDMRELGEHAESAHAAIGDALVRFGVHRIVGVGTDMNAAVDVAGRHGVPGVLVADSTLAKDAIGAIEPTDVVLVKGSRSMRMERVVEAIVAAEGVS